MSDGPYSFNTAAVLIGSEQSELNKTKAAFERRYKVFIEKYYRFGSFRNEFQPRPVRIFRG